MLIFLHSIGVRLLLQTTILGVREHQTLSYPKLISFTASRYKC